MDRLDSNQKNIDIFLAYERAIKDFGETAKFIAKNIIVERAMSYKAPRFYITYETARRIISDMKKGIEPRISNPLKRQMYNDLYEKYLKAEQKNTPFASLETILNSEAPSFYVDKPQFIKTITFMIKRGSKKCS